MKSSTLAVVMLASTLALAMPAHAQMTPKAMYERAQEREDRGVPRRKPRGDWFADELHLAV